MHHFWQDYDVLVRPGALDLTSADARPALRGAHRRNRCTSRQIARTFRHRARMWRNYIFGMQWKHQRKMYYDELSAESQEQAAGYFIDHCRDDVSLVRVELVGPDDSGVREYAHSAI